jgi:outer membrane autotransporter protein
MKHLIKFFLALGILFYSINVYSQIDKPITKGNIILGGGGELGFSNSNYDSHSTDYDYNSKGTSFSFSLDPRFGYFVFDGFVLGLSPSFSYGFGKSTSTSTYLGNPSDPMESKRHSYGIGLDVFVKYYFKNCIFIGLESGYLYSNSKYSDENNATKYNSFSISPAVGYAIFITPKVSIEPCLNYSYSLYTGKNPLDNSNSLDNDLSISVGFHWFL